jgi:hypothetical protein
MSIVNGSYRINRARWTITGDASQVLESYLTKAWYGYVENEMPYAICVRAETMGRYALYYRVSGYQHVLQTRRTRFIRRLERVGLSRLIYGKTTSVQYSSF